IPVMGHVGLTPQSVSRLGGYRAQGRTADDALAILAEAEALQDAGCFALVFEAVPAEVTALLVKRLTVPVIGIGAGPATDGQVLVFHDLLGMGEGPTPRFVKPYARLREQMIDGVARFAEEVRSRTYPAAEHTYPVAADELDRLRAHL